MMSWISILACFFIGFLFSGIEGGILAVNRIHVRHQARLGDLSAQQLDKMLGNLERLMISVLIVTNSVTIVAVALLFGNYAKAYGNWAGILAVAIGAPLFIFAMEFLPKAIFRRFPYKALAPLTKILGFTHQILRPFVYVGIKLTSLVLWKRSRYIPSTVSSDDIRRQIADRHLRGEVTSTEKDMIFHVLDFRQASLQQIVIPLEKVVMVSLDALIKDVLDLARQTDFERFPVQDANGNVQGLVQVYDLLIDGVKDGTIKPHLRRMVTVSITSEPHKVLQDLRTARMTLALVVTPEGKPAGIVSIEDLIRKLLLKTSTQKA